VAIARLRHRSSDAGEPECCLADLFPWVEVSIGAGGNGKPQPARFNDATTGEGATAMGFYNVQKGDMPYFTELAGNLRLATITISPSWAAPAQ